MKSMCVAVHPGQRDEEENFVVDRICCHISLPSVGECEPVRPPFADRHGVAEARDVVIRRCRRSHGSVIDKIRSERRDDSVGGRRETISRGRAARSGEALLGYGRDYQYAHDFEEQTAAMECLPDSLAGRRFYEPKDVGAEAEMKKRLERMREARKKK